MGYSEPKPNAESALPGSGAGYEPAGCAPMTRPAAWRRYDLLGDANNPRLSRSPHLEPTNGNQASLADLWTHLTRALETVRFCR